MARRILITGGAGFIGSHLVERLSADAEALVVVDNMSRGRRSWLPSEVDVHDVDLRAPDSLRRVVTGSRPEIVVHLAAIHFIPEVDGAPELARDVNVRGTDNLLAALEKEPPELLIFASSAAVYPDRRGPIPESCRVAPLDVYGRTKVEGELMVEKFAASTGTRCLTARLFNVIGRRETNPHVVPALVTQLREGSSAVRLGNLAPRRDYTDVVDVASALAALISTPPTGPRVFNVGSGRGTSVGDLVAACERLLGRSISVEIDPTRTRRQDRQELVADVTRLKQETGWEPYVSLEDTLALLLAET